MIELSDPIRWAEIDSDRERYILYMLGNDDAARRFWEEWLPEEIKRGGLRGVQYAGNGEHPLAGKRRTLEELPVCAVSSGTTTFFEGGNMASSLEELIEEWEARSDDLIEKHRTSEAFAISDCVGDLRDTMLVMQAEEVRRGRS